MSDLCIDIDARLAALAQGVAAGVHVGGRAPGLHRAAGVLGAGRG